MEHTLLDIKFSGIFPEILYEVFTLNDKINLFCNVITTFVNSDIPLIEIRKNIDKYPRNVQAAIDQKTYLFKAKKKDFNSFNLRYKDQCVLVKKLLNVYSVTKLENKLKSPKEFFNFVKQKTKPHLDLPVILVNNTALSKDEEKAKAFGEYFSKIFSKKPTKLIPKFEFRTNKFINNIEICVSEIDNELKSLPNKCNISADNIPSKLLKHCHTSLALPLTELYKMSLQTQKCPLIWKKSIIVPIPKNNKKCTLLSDYRPISLTCPILKLLEKIIFKNILNFLLKNNLLSDKQFGFLPKRSTVTQMISVMEVWFNSLYDGMNIDVIYVDLLKAFDSVNIEFLIYKLERYGIKNPLLGWLRDYLTGRTFMVKINENFSVEYPIYLGVPQGSILGPLLFVIFINDLPEKIGLKIEINLFADDIKLSNTHKNCDEVTNLQNNGLNKLVKWSKEWDIDINVDKCYVLCLGQNNMHYKYTINGSDLSILNTIDDLGFTINNKLDFSDHLKKIVKRAYFKVFQLFRVVKTKDPKIWSRAFKAYVRPVLEYGTELWNPTKLIDIIYIEKIQRFFTRKAYKKCGFQYEPYEIRLKKFALQTLEIRRK
jgi:hypothetical protein